MPEAWGADAALTKILIDHEAPLLTFDDGPSEWTGPILDLLRDHNQRAVFFITGQHVAAHTETVKRAFAEGHRIGNHGWSHRRLSTLDDNEIRNELVKTQRAIRDAIGIAPRVWRAPFYDPGENGIAIASKLGLRHVVANLTPDDWSKHDPEALAATVLELLRPGSVVSLHDGIPPAGGSETCTDSRAVTVEAVRLILEGMK